MKAVAETGVQLLINASDVSDARFRHGAQLGEALCARSIHPFERGRPWLRRTRASMGNERSGVWGWRSAEFAEGCKTEDLERENLVGEASWLIVDDDEEREEGFVCGRGRKRTESAETPTTIVMSMVASCGNGDRRRWGSE